ncbi:MAG: response regulator [Pseudanabaenaceae cyanobacterium]
MAADREWQVRLQFLDEAGDYLREIEHCLLGCSERGLARETIDVTLRAAHSIKGGAAMMGFAVLSDLAHRLEDALKVMQTGRVTPEPSLEQLFLDALTQMQRVSSLHQQEQPIDASWLVTEIEPPFVELYNRLGAPSDNDHAAALSAESGVDMRVIMFETEVDACLERLAQVLADPNTLVLREEFLLASQEFGCLGEMLDLPAFVALCNQITTAIEGNLVSLGTIAPVAFQAWRKSQALVMVGQWEALPDRLPIEVPGLTQPLEQNSTNSTHNHDDASEHTNGFDLFSTEITSESDLSRDNPIHHDLVGHRLEDLGEDLDDNFVLDEPITVLDPYFISDLTEATNNRSLDDPDSVDSSSDIKADQLTESSAIHDVDILDISENILEDIPESITESVSESISVDVLEEIPGNTPEIISETITENITKLVNVEQNLDYGSILETLGSDLSITDGATDLFTDMSADVSKIVVNSNAFNLSHNSSKTFASNNLSSNSNVNLNLNSNLNSSINPNTNLNSTNSNDTTEVNKPGLPAPSEVSLRVPLRYLEQLSELFGDINAERNSLNIQLKSLQNLVSLLRNRVMGLEVSNQQLRNAYDLVVGASPQPSLKSPESTNSTKENGQYNSKSLQILPLNITEDVLESPAITNNNNGIATDFDALEMDRYNSLHLLARDIMDSVVQLQEVSNDMDTTLNEAAGSARELGRVARQMQTNLERLRMRRLDEILSNFPRVLRELSLRYGKSVQLVVRGGSTLVERSVLEQLNDPLLHLLRNAFDHGIETTAERLAAGKNPKGTIEITAAYRGNQTTITLKDDGAGINLPKIREKAKLMGLSDQEIDQAGEAALLDLIFSPGFTTAETVTTLSGRGVGMDVVRTNLRRIGGDVTVQTKSGEGTTFILSVPVSLAIAQVLLVESNGFMMAVPVTAVEEMLLVEQYPVLESEAGQTLQWLEQTMPFINLADKFKFNRTQRFNSEENVPTVNRPVALVVRRGAELYALGCDKYWTEVEATMRSVQGSLTLPEGFTGCAVVGGGRLVPLMDIDQILDWLLVKEPVADLRNRVIYDDIETSGTVQHTPTVLTIDDSINVRRFLALMLEKAGYRVEQAKDGQEALDKLQQGLVIDAAICDIEMPRLDGFGFLAQARNQAAWADLPIIMLTSRSGDKHRNLAMNLGASGYFAKPFKETDLLATIADLIKGDGTSKTIDSQDPKIQNRIVSHAV